MGMTSELRTNSSIPTDLREAYENLHDCRLMLAEDIDNFFLLGYDSFHMVGYSLNVYLV